MTVSRLLNVPFFFDRVTIVFPGVWRQSVQSLERFIRKKVPAFTETVGEHGEEVPRYKGPRFAQDHGAAFHADGIDRTNFQKVKNAWADWVKSEGHADKFTDEVWGGNLRLQRRFPRTGSVLKKLARLAQEDASLRPLLMPILREAAEPHPEGMQAESNDIYDKQVDHGYEQPLSGGHDIMKRLQDRLLIEQGREPRETNPRLAATMSLQEGLIKLLHSPAGRDRVRQAVSRYAAETNTTIIVNAAVDDILHHAVAVALDPQKMGAVIAKHTVPDAS